MRSRDTLLLILVYHIRYTHGATPEAPESYMTIQYPYKDSCFLSSEGLILAAALSSHTWEHHPQDKRADIFVNGLEAGGLDLHAYELNHNNLHLDLGGLPSGVHIVRVDLYNALPGGARGLKIAQGTLEIRVGAEHCAYGCTEAGGSQHCPHAPPSTHALLAQELSMLTEKRQRLQQLGCNLALNKRAMQSSVQREGGGGGNAEYAVDGLTSLGQGDAAAPYFAETLEEAEPWWVVDLGADYTICGVGVWVHVILGNATDYPQAVPYSSAGDLRVTLFAGKKRFCNQFTCFYWYKSTNTDAEGAVLSIPENGSVSFDALMPPPADPFSRGAFFFETNTSAACGRGGQEGVGEGGGGELLGLVLEGT